MKLKKSIGSILLLLPFICFGQVNFDKNFLKQSLRVDFELAGNANEAFIVLQTMKQEPYWGGNPKQCIAKYDMGDYSITMKNLKGKLLFSKGFNSLFREWQTIDEAQKLNRSFHHAIQLPFPKDSVSIAIKSRQKDGQFITLLEWQVNPQDYHISREQSFAYPIDTLRYSGKSETNLDIVFIAEGYTKEQLKKFQADVRRFEKWIFSVNPFSDYHDRVNLYAVLCPSDDEGPDVPGEHIYQKTIVNSSFYTFDSPRYLTVRDTKKMYDLASAVPYDHVYVIVNTDIYGGAGFYNTYTSCASDCSFAEEIASHELGHGLIGLADEYYDNKNDAINYYYHLDIEPWEPNITSLVDFSDKWQGLIKPTTPIPTPRIPKYKNTLGAFEGGAYMNKGIYSPMQDCKMKSNNTKLLCPACKEATHKIIKTYLE